MRFSTTRRNAAIAAAIAGSLLLGGTAQADSYNNDGGMMEPTTQQSDPMGTTGTTGDTASMSIVEVASGNDSFNTLVQAVQAAGLGDTLSGEGPYTVFAPTDEAFAQLPDGALEYLLQPENQDLLAQVLSYHVVEGSVTSSELSTGGVDTLGGGVAVAVRDSGIVVNNASVVNPNIQASNGVIHAVNRVLLPETLQQQLASRLGVDSIY
ncbi:beta-Ig-H3/fasciclin [filamentous cyanobacterium CCT1]|nr:beta-Ig-H3/fasciclin [filamentous cyanobacterium CCT1]